MSQKSINNTTTTQLVSLKGILITYLLLLYLIIYLLWETLTHVSKKH